MPFVFLGLIISTIGFFLLRWSMGKKSHEMINGSAAALLAGVLVFLWGLVLIFTGNLSVL